MNRPRTARSGIPGPTAAALLLVAAILSPGGAFGRSPAARPLTMEELEIHGAGELPERMYAPAPMPEHPADPVRWELLRERILAPISPWENDDEARRTGMDRVETNDRD